MNFDVFNAQDGVPDPSRALAMFPRLVSFYDGLGNTPLEAVPGPADGARIMAKMEFNNPFGSVKDRTAFGIFCDAVNRHDFHRQPLKLLDASGGNMGRALAKICQLCEIPVHLVIPDSSPDTLIAMLRDAGAELTLVDRRYFLLGMIARAQEIKQQNPEWTLLSQHLNLANVAVHQYQTGREIICQLGDNKADGWVAAVGTGGTLSGVFAALSAENPALRVQGTTPKEMPYATLSPPDGRDKFAGAGGMGFGFRQPFIDRMNRKNIPFCHVSWQESLSGMYEFYRLTGVRIGASAAANWKSAYQLAQTMDPDHVVVTLFADAGSDSDREKGKAFFSQLEPVHT
ncbi:pyridoxal-phosphate dependent enzyme [Martelella alba]|uniref:Pyridoxal-phosphate dependent enzyme n=1 Tax=Martelella alba TaxID=2590451 RepID=A0ABY2SHN4_9HYPH|nr:pyridoxal-phosphate dependent enzyme [Martelella alba]TKI04470.1 pyridoxal-phosphate dependent enzyme [Martelella alba]